MRFTWRIIINTFNFIVMKLISMTDFVLEKQMSDKTIMNRFTQISNYANFLKQPLELWMFLPCDEEGNVLEEPLQEHYTDCNDEQNAKDWLYNLEKYQQAKKICLFEGFEYVNEDFIHKTIHYFIKKENSKIMFNFNNEWRFYPEFKTIEDLLKHSPILTPTAIKQLGI